jgi:hypothetical protein
MKTFQSLLSIITVILLLTATSCSALRNKNEGATGKSTKAEEKASDRVAAVNQALVSNDRKKLETIGFFAAGTDYALNKIPDPPVEVEAAKDLNARILTLSPSPVFSELKAAKQLVDELTSQLATEREAGAKNLVKKDLLIQSIQKEKQTLEKAKEDEIKKYMNIAQAAAAKADQYVATLNQMDSMWGLGAVFYGLKKFVVRGALVFGIMGVLYLVLRVASTVNPIAASIFSIFDMMVSFVIKLLQSLAPGAAKMAKLVPEATATLYKQTLGHMVDTIEMIKTKDKESVVAGQAPEKYTLNDILTKFSETMDQKNKDVVKEVKTELNWK